MASIVVLGVALRAGAVLQVQGNVLLEVWNLPRRLKILCCLSRTEKVINISVLGTYKPRLSLRRPASSYLVESILRTYYDITRHMRVPISNSMLHLLRR